MFFFNSFTHRSNMLNIFGLKYIHSFHFHIHYRSFIQWKVFDWIEFSSRFFTSIISQFKNTIIHFIGLPKLSLYYIGCFLVLQQRLETIITSGSWNDFIMFDIYLLIDSRITLILFWEEEIYWMHRGSWVCQESQWWWQENDDYFLITIINNLNIE